MFIFLSQVTVTDRAGKEVNFPANVWLSSDPGKALMVNLAKGKNLFLDLETVTSMLLRIVLGVYFSCVLDIPHIKNIRCLDKQYFVCKILMCGSGRTGYQ